MENGSGIKRIEKSIDINAPREKVWEVLLEDKYLRIWCAEFMPGTYAVTDWKVGSRVTFQDSNNSGLISKIIVNEPNEVISMEHQGMIMNGVDDYESKDAKSVKGALETYRLSEKDGGTHLEIECDMDERMFDEMASAWDRALQKVKELSETNS